MGNYSIIDTVDKNDIFLEENIQNINVITDVRNSKLIRIDTDKIDIIIKKIKNYINELPKSSNNVYDIIYLIMCNNFFQLFSDQYILNNKINTIKPFFSNIYSYLIDDNYIITDNSIINNTPDISGTSGTLGDTPDISGTSGDTPPSDIPNTPSGTPTPQVIP
jgi:hypothetical protein